MKAPVMDRKRLTILRGVLERWATYRGNLQFDLGAWLELPDEYQNQDALKVLQKAISGDNYCGTTACACGVAASIPSFKRDGLTLVRLGTTGQVIPRYKSFGNYAAVQEFFGLTMQQTVWLFSPAEYALSLQKSPSAVAERILMLLTNSPSLPDMQRISVGGYWDWNAGGRNYNRP